MNAEHAYDNTTNATYTVFHSYELLWWAGTCGSLLLIIFFILLRYNRMKKILQQQAATLADIEQTKALFSQAAVELPDTVFITTPAGHIQFCNTETQQKSGYTQEELIGQPPSLLLPESLTEQQTIQAKKKDGTTYPAALFTKELQDSQGKLIGHLFVLKDRRASQQIEREQAAEQRKLTERLMKARRLETVGLMAGEVAHDLNNILAGVLHYPEQILRSLPEASHLRPSLVSITRSARQAVALVADLLSAAKAGSAVKEITDLNKLIEKTIAAQEYQDLFSKRPGITLRVRLCSDPLPISCSPPHIRQCLHNLLINGFDSMNSGEKVGTISISVDRRYLTEPPATSPQKATGDYAILSVADTGPSMSSTTRAHIFEPFYSKKKLNRGGTGIALAVLRNIVEEHGGWIDIPIVNSPGLAHPEQESSHGNRFDLYFPIRSLQNIAQASDGQELPGQGQRLLFIEKDKEQQEKHIEFLTDIGYKAMSVADEKGAVSFLNRNRVDLIILDIVQDELMEGVELYEQIRFLHPSQKALIICSSPECQSVKEIQQHGEVSLLPAPFDQEQLQEAVMKVLAPTSE